MDELSLQVENDIILLHDPIGEMLDIDITKTLPLDDKEEEYDEDDLNSDED